MIRRRKRPPDERSAAFRQENRNRRLFASPIGEGARRFAEALRRKKRGGDENKSGE